MFACFWYRKQLVDASTQTETEAETNVKPQLARKAQSRPCCNQDMQHMLNFYDRVDSLFNSAAQRQSYEQHMSSQNITTSSQSRLRHLNNSREFTDL